MGLDDRDYMRERNRRILSTEAGRRERPFAPPKESSTLSIVLCWLLVAFLAYKGYGWWEEKRELRRAAKAAASSAAFETAPAQVARTTESPQEAPSPRQRALPAPMTIPRSEPEPPLSRPAPATSGTIYLCKAYDGRTFWAQAHCSQHQALIDSIANVPPGLPFDEQVAVAQRNRRELAQTVYATPAPPPTDREAINRKSECEHLDARVRHLDAMARQPQSGEMQDWIRGQRQSARNRQFALRC
jgi:hypothetical protein